MSPSTHAEPMYADLNIMLLKKLYLYTLDLFMYKFSNGMLPELFADAFTHVNTIRDRNTRMYINNNLCLLPYKTTRSQ